jgi:hypothetical protein
VEIAIGGLSMQRTLIIGVVTYNNSERQLGQLSKSIDLAIKCLDDMPAAVEVFTIDNGQETCWPESHYPRRRFASLGNVGFGGAMNRLMAEAFGKTETGWFLCLNPDGALHYNCLRELLKSSDSSPDCLIEARQFPEEHPKQYDPATLATPWASGACLLIPVGVYRTIGGFDPNFFIYLEDVDLSWRARLAGLAVKIAPAALFAHAVLNRKHNPRTDCAMLLSSRYLGHKWRNASFIEWAEDELIRRGHFAEAKHFPALPATDFDPGRADRTIPDFGHLCYFSPPRW